MSYDPTTIELQRLRNELQQLQRDHLEEASERRRDTTKVTHWLGLAVIFGTSAIFWLGFAIFAFYQRLSESCGCG